MDNLSVGVGADPPESAIRAVVVRLNVEKHLMQLEDERQDAISQNLESSINIGTQNELENAREELEASRLSPEEL